MKGIFVSESGFAPCMVRNVVVGLEGNESTFVEVDVDGDTMSVDPKNVQSTESILDYNVLPTFPTLLVQKADYRALAMRTGSRQRKPRTKKS